MTMNLLQRLIVSELLSQERGSPNDVKATMLRGIYKKVRLDPEHAKEYGFEPLPGRTVWDEKRMRAVDSTVELDEKEQKALSQTLGACTGMTIVQADALESLLAELGLPV